MAELYHTIYSHEDITPDHVIAGFLLKEFGDSKYPGIHQARFEVSKKLPKEQIGKELEKKGILSIGFDDALFTSLGTQTITEQVVKNLGLQDENAAKELIHIAEGDQAQQYKSFFEIIQNIIEEYKEKPSKVFKSSHPLLASQYHAFREELDPIPTEYLRCMQDGKMHAFIANQKREEIRVIVIESNHPEMGPFVHNHKEIKADVVAQIFEGGHVNITVKYRKRIDLDDVISILRIEEGRKKKLPFDKLNWNDLKNPDRVEHLEEWKYDPELPGIFNTKAIGLARNGATQLEMEDIKKALVNGLDYQKLERKCPPVGCRGKKCRFYFYNLDRCRKRRKNTDIEEKKLVVQQHVQILDREALVHMSDPEEEKLTGSLGDNEDK